MKQRKPIELFLSWLPVAGLFLVIFLRFLYLDSNDLAMDEPFTVFFAQADLPALFGMLHYENNPPLFFLLMHFWTGWFGISPVSVRFLSCVFSILTAFMLFKTGKDFFSWKVGLVAAGLFTLSDYHQLFAHEARVYALFALLTTVSMYFFLALTSRPEKKRYMMLLSLINVLLIYSHFFGFFIFLIQGLSVFLIPEYRKTILKFFLVSVLLSLIAYIPYFPIFFSRFFQSAGNGTWVEPPVVSDLYTMVWRYLNAPVVTVAVIFLLTFALIRFILRSRKGMASPESKYIVLAIWFLVPYLLMFLVSFRIPVFLDRYTVFISVGFYLLAAVAINYLVTGLRPFLILVSVLLLMMAITFHPGVDNKRRLKETVSFVSALKHPGTIVIICPPWLEYGFSYHYDPLIFKDYNNLRSLLNQDNIYPVNNHSFLDTNKIKNSTQVLMLEEWASLTDPENTLFKFLDREFRYTKTVTFYQNFKVHRYTR